jgi:hypothetical protein
MKREKETYPKVKTYKSYFFWEECRFCHKEFRREQGFKIIDAPDLYGDHTITYSCNDCTSSINDVKEKINQEHIKFLNSKPKAPSGIKVVRHG